MSQGMAADQAGEKIFRLIERKRHDQARALLGDALRQAPDDPVLHYYSAYLSWIAKEYREAEQTLKGVLQSDPDDADAQFLLAQVYQDMHRYGEAEGLIIELLGHYPQSATYYAFYAEIMLLTLHLEKAHRLAQEAVRIDPEHLTAQAVSLLCELILNNRQETQERLGELVRKFPEARTSAAMVLVVLGHKGRHREALGVAQALLRSEPGNQEILETVIELKTLTHPTMLPLLPMIRYGWHGSALLWFAGISIAWLLQKYASPTVTLAFMGGWLGYIVYSWVYPPILRKILS